MDAGGIGFKSFLQKQFEDRCSRNASYSLRAFARDLKLSPAGVSQILNGKQGVSPQTAETIARRLGLSSHECDYLVDLASSEFARSRKSKEAAIHRLRVRKPVPPITLEVFKAISEWHHLALLELTMLKGFKSDAGWIARKLGISKKTVSLAIERLKMLGFLKEQDGKLIQTTEYMATPSGVPSTAIRGFHQQVLRKAIDALHSQSVDERDFSSIVLPVSTNDMVEAKEWIKKFRREFMSRFGSAAEKDSVYCLSVQFFSLLKENSGKNFVDEESNETEQFKE
ncbi:MAG: TIGR02147 family protein [Bdellovibrionota bacterium]